MRAAAKPFDVLVSDLGLPDRSGLDLVRELAARHPGRALPAIALSGYATGDDVQRSRAAGFRMHLSKPVDFSTLMNAIESTARATDVGAAAV